MAKHKKSCTVHKISFKTKRGRRVTFHGRSGGQKRAGGICANKSDTAGEKRVQRAFAKAARSKSCPKRPGKRRGACVAAAFRRLYRAG